MSGTIHDDHPPKLAKRPTTGKQRPLPGRENQLTVAGIRRNHSPPPSRNLLVRRVPRSKSERHGGQSRARRLVGNVMDSFKKSANKPSTPSALALALEQWPLPTEYWDDTTTTTQMMRQKESSLEDQSQTSALTDSDTSAPSMGIEDPFVGSFSELGKGIRSGVRQTERGSHSSRLSPISAATRLQSVFRGYRQRYEFRTMRLRRKLEQIEALKQRQLATLARRTKSQKKMDKSVADFHHGKATRQLMRFTRVIPYLFREAQAKLAENVALARACPAMLVARVVPQLLESDQSLQRIAHLYLESLEDLPGIWEALRGQWMAPKKPRPRRIFGNDGKPKKVDPKTQYNTQDQDLPVLTIQSQRFVQRMDSLPHRMAFEELRAQAFATVGSMTNEEMDRAVDQVKAVVGIGLWN